MCSLGDLSCVLKTERRRAWKRSAKNSWLSPH